MAKTANKIVRERLHIQRDQRGQIFVGRRRQTERTRNRSIRLLVSNYFKPVYYIVLLNYNYGVKFIIICIVYCDITVY